MYGVDYGVWGDGGVGELVECIVVFFYCLVGVCWIV